MVVQVATNSLASQFNDFVISPCHIAPTYLYCGITVKCYKSVVIVNKFVLQPLNYHTAEMTQSQECLLKSHMPDFNAFGIKLLCHDVIGTSNNCKCLVKSYSIALNFC